MKAYWWAVLLVSSLGMLPLHANAGNCPTTPTKATTVSSCTCPSGLSKITATKKFRTTRLNLRRECAAAARKARQICARRGRIAGFRVVGKRHRVKRIGRVKVGFCQVRSVCRWFTIKRTFTRAVQGRPRLFQVKGNHMTMVRGRLSARAVCARTALRARKHLARKYRGKVTSFRVLKRQYKKRKVFGSTRGYCKIWYSAKILRASRSLRRFFFCAIR